MRIAALIFGILAGLSSLPLATYGHALIGLGGGKDGSALYLIPILSFIGAGLALNVPAVASVLLALSASALLFLGAQAGYAVNIITIGPVIFNAVGALLAGVGYSKSRPDLMVGVASDVLVPFEDPRLTARASSQASAPPSAFGWRPNAQSEPDGAFDRAKWAALVKYDDDIARVAEQVRLLGPKWSDVLAADYLALGDKTYLPSIIRKILEQAKQEQQAADESRLRGQEGPLKIAAVSIQLDKRDVPRSDAAPAKASVLAFVGVILTAALLSVGAYNWSWIHGSAGAAHAVSNTAGPKHLGAARPKQAVVEGSAIEAIRREYLDLLSLDTYGNPDHIKPGSVKVSGDFAMLEWVGDNTGGNALFRYDAPTQKWDLVVSDGGAFSAEFLIKQYSVPESAARSLTR